MLQHRRTLKHFAKEKEDRHKGPQLYDSMIGIGKVIQTLDFGDKYSKIRLWTCPTV